MYICTVVNNNIALPKDYNGDTSFVWRKELTKSILCEISGSHSDEYEDESLLGYSVV
jgi:hypothetical protein